MSRYHLANKTDLELEQAVESGVHKLQSISISINISGQHISVDMYPAAEALNALSEQLHRIEARLNDLENNEIFQRIANASSLK